MSAVTVTPLTLPAATVTPLPVADSAERVELLLVDAPPVELVAAGPRGEKGIDGLALTLDVLEQIRAEIDSRTPDPGDLTLLFDNGLV